MPLPPFTPPARVTRLLAGGAALLVLGAFVARSVRDSVDLAFLDPGRKGNLPAWFLSSSFLGAALLLARIAAAARAARDRFFAAWPALAAILVLLSLDAAVVWPASGIAAAALAARLLAGIGIAGLSLRAGAATPATRALLVLAGGLLAASAVGSLVAARAAWKVLDLAGAVILVHALLVHIERTAPASPAHLFEGSPGRVTRVLAVAVVLLVLTSLALLHLRLAHGIRPGRAVARSVDLDQEANLPAWYASSTLLISALLLARIAALARAAGDPFRRHWAFLAAVFVFLSVDEMAEIHESAAAPIRNALGTGGFLYWAWVVAAIPAVAALGLAYRRFVASLPARTRALVVAAGVAYVAGALGLEMVGARIFHARGRSGLDYALVATAEEALEMLGVLIFIHALLEHLEPISSRRQL